MIIGTAVVTAVEQLSPTFARVELGGDDLADFGVDGPTYDQRIKLLFGPADDQVMRTYTIREVRPGPRLVVDFVLHLTPGASGPAAEWAASASVGDTVGIIAPKAGEYFGGIEWAPGSASQVLLAGDETAAPAICAIVETLPDDARGAAYIEVPCVDDVLDLRVPAGISMEWLVRDDAPHGARLSEAVRGSGLLPRVARASVGSVGSVGAAPSPPSPDEVDPDLWETPVYSSSGEEVADTAPAPGDLYAWIAGEAGVVTGLRRHLVRELGLDRRQVAFMGYWRQGRQHA